MTYYVNENLKGLTEGEDTAQIRKSVNRKSAGCEKVLNLLFFLITAHCCTIGKIDFSTLHLPLEQCRYYRWDYGTIGLMKPLDRGKVRQMMYVDPMHTTLQNEVM